MVTVVGTLTFLLLVFISSVCSSAHEGETYDISQDPLEEYRKLAPELTELDSQIFPYSENDLQYVEKRVFPYWFNSYRFREPTYDTATIERKRFFAFHPLPRFRGISMGSGSRATGGLFYEGRSRGRPRSFAPFSSSFMSSPAHPVPSDSRMRSLMSVSNRDDRFGRPGVDKPASVTFSSYFNGIAPHRGSKGRNKISRFESK